MTWFARRGSGEEAAEGWPRAEELGEGWDLLCLGARQVFEAMADAAAVLAWGH